MSSFRVLGTLGFACAGATALVLAKLLGLSIAVFGLLIAASAVTFFVVAFATLAIRGEERLVYYHHELAVLAVSALLVAGLGLPVLAYVDVVVVALGVFLTFGRLACFSVGCCHGAPHRWGVRYGHAHAAQGFPRCLVGVRLVPVQPMESFAVLVLTGVSIAELVGGAVPGSVIGRQLVAYAVVRFVLEFARGDDLRPFWRGLSEAQWTSLALGLFVVAAEAADWLPRSTWSAVAVAGLGVAVLAVSSGWWGERSSRRLLAPAHVYEIAEAMDSDARARAPKAVTVRVTSLGVRLSSCTVDADGALARLYTMSGIDGSSATTLSKLILRLQAQAAHGTLSERGSGVFQLVVTVEPSFER